jgi:hypothetical protein
VTRNLLLSIISFLLTASCQQEVKSLKGRPYEVSGQVGHCEGCEVKLQLYDYNRFATEQTAILEDTVKDGRFQLKGRTTRPGFYEIHLIPQQVRRPLRAIIYLPADPVHIRADILGLPR